MSVPGRARTDLLWRFADLYERHRFASLFYTLLLTLGAEPVLSLLFTHSLGLIALLTLNMIAAVFGVLPRRYAMPATVLVAIFIGIRILHGALGATHVIDAAGDVAWVSVTIPAALVALRHALRGGTVDRERVFAALDAYLIFGLVFGLIYWRVEQAWPGSLAQTVPGAMSPLRAIYFSFVTLVTLGYGDIVPATDALRGVVMLESLCGHFFVIVLVARLVGLHTVTATKS